MSLLVAGNGIDILPAVFVLLDYPTDRFSAEAIELRFIKRSLDNDECDVVPLR